MTSSIPAVGHAHGATFLPRNFLAMLLVFVVIILPTPASIALVGVANLEKVKSFPPSYDVS